MKPIQFIIKAAILLIIIVYLSASWPTIEKVLSFVCYVFIVYKVFLKE